MANIRLAAARVRSNHGLRHALWLAAFLVLPGLAQNAPQPRILLPQGQPQRSIDSDMGIRDLDDPQRRNAMLNRERHKKIVSDTDKLFRLAGELDLEIRAASPAALTPAQYRKLAEIEKLAHNVKEKMSYSVQSTTDVQQPVRFPVR